MKPLTTALQYNLCFNADFGTENFDKAFVQLRIQTPTGRISKSFNGKEVFEYREFCVQLTDYLSEDDARDEIKRLRELQPQTSYSYGCDESVVWR